MKNPPSRINLIIPFIFHGKLRKHFLTPRMLTSSDFSLTCKNCRSRKQFSRMSVFMKTDNRLLMRKYTSDHEKVMWRDHVALLVGTIGNVSTICAASTGWVTASGSFQNGASYHHEESS